jgi:hypothetical protein
MAAMAAVPGTTATSTTSLTIGTGAQTLTVETGLSYIAGMELVIASAATPTDRMIGTVTAYDAGTGELNVTVTSASGIGTYADWKISLTIAVSFDGRTYTDLVLAGSLTETPVELTGTDINPSISSVLFKTLTGNVTLTESIAEGQSVTVVLTTGAYSVVLPTTEWLWDTAPVASATGATVIIWFKVNGVLYGLFAGSTT